MLPIALTREPKSPLRLDIAFTMSMFPDSLSASNLDTMLDKLSISVLTIPALILASSKVVRPNIPSICLAALFTEDKLRTGLIVGVLLISPLTMSAIRDTGSNIESITDSPSPVVALFTNFAYFAIP